MLLVCIEMSGVSIGVKLLEASTKVGDGVDKFSTGPQGVDITVWSKYGDFSAMGYVVDQLDSLIDEWFPGKLRSNTRNVCLIEIMHAGLNSVDADEEWLVLRQVLWKVPESLLKESVDVEKPKSLSLDAIFREQRGEVRG